MDAEYDNDDVKMPTEIDPDFWMKDELARKALVDAGQEFDYQVKSRRLTVLKQGYSSATSVLQQCYISLMAVLHLCFLSATPVLL